MAEVAVETERLRLRTWNETDKAEFVRVTNRPPVMRWLGGVQSEQAMATAFERIDGYQRDFGHTLWVVERKSDEALLGYIPGIIHAIYIILKR